MSMWEIEGLIEDSVRLVASTNKKNEEKRQLIHNLYLTQNQFDCSFTHFRLMPLLLDASYAKAIELEEYPSYQEHQAYFGELRQQDFAYIHKDITQPWSNENPVYAYWDKNTAKVYYDFSSPLWQQLEKTEKSADLTPISLVQQIVELAHQKEDKALIYHWSAFAIVYEYYFYPDIADMKALKNAFLPIKEIFHQYNFEGFEPMHHSFDLEELAGAVEAGYFEEKTTELYQWFMEKP